MFDESSIAWLRDRFGGKTTLHRGLENSETCLAYFIINYHNKFYCIRVKVVSQLHLKNICGIYPYLSQTRNLFIVKCNSSRITINNPEYLNFFLYYCKYNSYSQLSETICQLTWMIRKIMTSIETIVFLASAYVNMNNIHRFAYFNFCKAKISW